MFPEGNVVKPGAEVDGGKPLCAGVSDALESFVDRGYAVFVRQGRFVKGPVIQNNS